MDVDATPKKYARTPAHLKRFRSVTGFGPTKLRALAAKLPNEDALAAATTVDDFKIPSKISTSLAEKLLAVKNGDASQPTDFFGGEKRVVLWNTLSGKKIAGAAAPKESRAEEWLKLPGNSHYEVYSGQDDKKMSPTDIPNANLMEEVEYDAFCIDEASTDLQAALSRAAAILQPYGLKVLPLPDASAGYGGPELGSLHCALLFAAAILEGDVDSLHKECLEKVGVVEPSLPKPLLQLASDKLKRPVWVWTGKAGEANVFQVDDSDHDPTQVTPVRLAQVGGRFFAVVPSDHTGDVVVNLAQSVPHADLPDLKEDVSRALADLAAQIDETEKWSADNNVQYNLELPRQEIAQLQRRLKDGCGKTAVFLGLNNVGKSTLINLKILNSTVDEGEYVRGRRSDYVLEALQGLVSTDKAKQEPPSFSHLLENPGDVRHCDVTVVIFRIEELSAEHGYRPSMTFEEAASRAAAEHSQMEESIKRWCIKGGDKPSLDRFVLPCGDPGLSTTSIHTHVRYGTVVHLLVEHYSVDELKKQAFQFVTLLKNLDGEDPRQLEETAKEALLEAWHLYKSVKEGPCKQSRRLGGLPELESLEAKWQDIEVCPEMLQIISSPMRVYLGTGKSIHLDRVMAYDLIKKFNDKGMLYRYAIKCIENFQPAAVLEGGNGFVDLPGTNDVDTGCIAQTREGIKEAGVVFVVLDKSLNQGKDALKLLKESDTIKRAASGDANVVFLFNREKQTTFNHRQLETASEVAARRTLEASTRQLWEEELLEAHDELVQEGETQRTEAQVKQLAADTPMRTIYPMLHSAFMLDWEFAERQRETVGPLSGSVKTFELSNVHWLLGILESLNRESLVQELKQVATVHLPQLREKLHLSLKDAKNELGGLPEALVGKAASILKSKRYLDSQLNSVAGELAAKVHELGALSEGAEETSLRLKINSIVHDFVMAGPEVQEYLNKGRAVSDSRWGKMSKAMKRIHQAVGAVDPRNKGNTLGFSLVPMIFGNNSRHVPMDFERLEQEVDGCLKTMLEKVIDLVIEHVDQLIGLGDQSPSTRVLKESFLELDVTRPLQHRFDLPFFIKVGHRDQLLNDGKLNPFLKRQAASYGTKAVERVILRANPPDSVLGIKNFIEERREPVRGAWQRILKENIQSLFSEQFIKLMNDLTNFKGESKRTKHYSLRSMLAAFLQHIVRTDTMQKSSVLQTQLSTLIKDLAYKTDALRSLWARLDGQDDPCKLGAASARHVERRRQRERTLRHAKVIVTLRAPTRAMPVTDLQPSHKRKDRVICEAISSTYEQKFIFIATDEEQVAPLRAELRGAYKLDMNHSPGNLSDLFSVLALVAYKGDQLKSARDPNDPARSLTMNEHIAFAAEQLRAIVVAEMAHFIRVDSRAAMLAKVICEKSEDYIARLSAGGYKGDLLCLYFFARHFQRAFRVWAPGVGSFLVPAGDEPGHARTKCAYQLMLAAEEPNVEAGSAPAASYKPIWFPIVWQKAPTASTSRASSPGPSTPSTAGHASPSGSRVSFSNVDVVREFSITDDEAAARVTDDPNTLARLPFVGKRKKAAAAAVAAEERANASQAQSPNVGSFFPGTGGGKRRR